MSAEPFVLGSRDFGEEVAACIQIDPRSHLRLNSTEARALHRYLSALVLPTVEKINLFALGPNAAEFPAYRNSILGDLQVLGHTKFSPGILVDDNTEEPLSPTQARALAACLLAAADEAEGAL